MIIPVTSMAVRRSNAADISRLLDALASSDERRREAAAARLVILGRQAIRPLRVLVASDTAAPRARIGALKVLTAIEEGDSIQAAAAAIRSGHDGLAIEAVKILCGALDASSANATTALDALTSLALAIDASATPRLAAIDALESLPDTLWRPIRDVLLTDPNPKVAARARHAATDQPHALEHLIEERFETPSDRAAAIVAEHGPTAAITLLCRAIDALRRREQEDPAGRTAWFVLRGQVHQMLAGRQSRAGLYDLRDALERGPFPLPLGFLAAAAAVADASCLDGIAKAWMHAPAGDGWFRERLEDVFRSVVSREGVHRDHTALTRLLSRHPTAATLVAMAPKRTRSRRSTGSGRA